MKSYKLLVLNFVLMLSFASLGQAEEIMISSLDFSGSKNIVSSSVCADKALENFIQYSILNKDYYANLNSFSFKKEEKAIGVTVAVYSMTFLIEDKIETINTRVKKLDGTCF